jgi:Cu(I)/Ag(I) efflux system membrane protein CusA/SilA
MKRIAAPMVGGIFTSFIMELLIYPLVFELWKRKTIAEPLQHSRAGMAAGQQGQPSMALSAAQD